MQLNYGKAVSEGEPAPLRSVFEFLKTGKTQNPAFGYGVLSIERDSIFPNCHQQDFKTLFNGFEAEWNNLKKLQPEHFVDTLLFLSKKYFSNAGCSPELPHISLHEHLKTAAALADCLARSDSREVLLVGAGLDNIQGFCYDIASSKAAKSLKGRSFFLQMLLDTISKEITSKTGTTVGHIVYARGGKVFLLLPDSPLIRQTLGDIKAQLNRDIWARYRASLFMFLKYESFGASTSDLGQVWKNLQAKIRQDKQQKNREILTTDFGKFFEPIPEGFKPGDLQGEKQFCRVTGELIEHANNKTNNIEANPTADPIWVQASVKFQSELGEALREAKDYLQWSAKATHTIDDEAPIFTGSKTILTVPEEGNWSLRHARPFKNDFVPAFRFKLNDLKFLPASPNGTGYGFAFYGGNMQATLTEKNGETRIKQFSELAGLEDDADKGEGFTRLGIGRMDVDGLGDMAAKAEASFALNATFSARFDLFLSGYINTVRASEQDYVDFLNIVFSGGDDMLIVGRWDLTLDFLAELREDFRKFQGGDFLTMSAGLVLVTPKFPIAKAVEMAGKAEDEAKGFAGKNALCFLGEVISWHEEFEFVHYFSKKLSEWLDDADSGISMSLIFKLYRFYEMQSAGIPDWRWLSAWYFQQCEKKNARSEAIFACLKTFVMTGKWELNGEKEEYKFQPIRALLLLSLGARIADFKDRKRKNLKLKS